MTTPPHAAANAPAELDALVQLSFAVQQVITRVAARYDASVTQARLFGVLRGREPAMGALSDLLALEKSSVSGLIDRAERRGLVARTPGHADGRTVHVRLTDAGAALTDRFAREVYAELDELLSSLPARDRRRLFALAGAALGAPALA